MMYPLTIVKDRYGGAYSNAKYTAWNKAPIDVPWAIYADDSNCAVFWADNSHICGKGSTPKEAIDNLKEKL